MMQPYACNRSTLTLDSGLQFTITTINKRNPAWSGRIEVAFGDRDIHKCVTTPTRQLLSRRAESPFS